MINNENIIKFRLLTLKEAAKLIDGLSVYRIKMLCINGDIKHHRFGRKFMISEKSLLDYFNVPNLYNE